MSMAVLSIGIAVYAIYIAGGEEAMTQPLPPFVIGFFVLAGIGVSIALYNGIRMIIAPEDKRLDDLINAVKALQNAEYSNNPKITIETKIDMADIAKMNPEQIVAFRELISKMPDKKSKGK